MREREWWGGRGITTPLPPPTHTETIMHADVRDFADLNGEFKALSPVTLKTLS